MQRLSKGIRGKQAALAGKGMTFPLSAKADSPHVIKIMGKNKIYLLKSAKGTGKTEVIGEIVKNNPHLKVLAITFRRTLTTQIARRMGLTDYQDLYKANSLDVEAYNKANRLATCIDSIIHLEDLGKWDLIILDECEQILRHLANSRTLDTKRSDVNKVLEILIKLTPYVIGLDADLSKITYNYMLKFTEPENIKVIVNQHKPVQNVPLNLAGSLEEAIALIDHALVSGQNVYVPVTSLKLTKYLAEYYARYRPVVINSETTGKANIKEYMSNINRECKLKFTRLIIGSPSIFTGLDISEKHFDLTVLIVDSKDFTHADLLQAIGRNRKAEKVIAYLPAFSVTDNPTSPSYWRKHALNKKEVSDSLIKREYDSTSGKKYLTDRDKHLLELYSFVQADFAESTNNLVANFIQAAIGEGYKVGVTPNLDNDKDKLKAMGLDTDEFITEGEVVETETLEAVREVQREIRKEVKEAEIQTILNATPVDDNTYEKLQAKRNKLSPEETAAVIKGTLERLYQVPLTEEIVKREGKTFKFSKQLKNYMMLKGMIDPATLDKENREAQGASFLDHTHYTASIELAKLLISQVPLEGKFKASDLSPKLLSWIEANADYFHAFFNAPVKKDFRQKPVEFISRILAKFGMRLQRMQYLEGEKRVSYYKLDASSVALMQEWAVKRLKAMGRAA